MIRKLIIGTLAMSMAAITTTHAQPAAEQKKETPAAPAAPALDPAEVKSSSSYALGFRAGSEFGQQFSRFGLTVADIEGASFLKGFLSAFEGKPPEIAEDKIQAAMQAFGDKLQAREKQVGESNLASGKKFLEDNGKRKEVTTTTSGLQYEVIAKGGDQKYVAPKEGEQGEKQFQVRYKGTLIDGKQFDASPEGQTVPMTLQVVPGFKEALTSMPVGAKWKLFLPSELAYGAERRSADIGPNSVLVFELELVAIEAAPARQEMPFPMPGQGQ